MRRLVAAPVADYQPPCTPGGADFPSHLDSLRASVGNFAMPKQNIEELCYRMLNPPKPPPLTYEQKKEMFERAVKQIRESAGNMGADCPVLPECWRGLVKAAGGQ